MSARVAAILAAGFVAGSIIVALLLGDGIYATHTDVKRGLIVMTT